MNPCTELSELRSAVPSGTIVDYCFPADSSEVPEGWRLHGWQTMLFALVVPSEDDNPYRPELARWVYLEKL